MSVPVIAVCTRRAGHPLRLVQRHALLEVTQAVWARAVVLVLDHPLDDRSKLSRINDHVGSVPFRSGVGATGNRIVVIQSQRRGERVVAIQLAIQLVANFQDTRAPGDIAIMLVRPAP